MERRSIILFLTSLVNFVTSSSIPRGLAWSSTTYGPDGPWHAITVKIGSPPQALDLFPGGFWQSNILSSSICTSTASQTCYAPVAGLYNESASDGATSLSETGGVENSTFADKGMLSLFGNGEYVFDSASIVTEDPPSASVVYEDFDMMVISEGYETLPDGTKYAIEVGNLALGAPEVNQSWNNGIGLFNSSLVPSYLYLTDQVPSNSFGMHIGSTAMAIPPSLYIGGYDQSRVLGEVTVQNYNMHYFPIDLLDIGLGVAEGASPFSFTSKSGLLASGNSSIGVAMQVIVDPVAPFLYLPQSTCNEIAANLPVKYQSNLGLYLWDTTDPAYEKIITSPAFLSFTFRLNSSITQNLTINVPFSLLNLTLTPPLVTKPTGYFPCNSFDYGKSYGEYTLGKAFLQAAFLGVNWMLDGNGVWFLAQAPGPNTPSQAVVKNIELNDDFLMPSPNVWADTWKGAWTVTPLASSTSSGDSSNASTSSASSNSSTLSEASDNKKSSLGLQKGAIAGIVVGFISVSATVLVVVIIFWRRRTTRGARKEVQGVEEVEEVERPVSYQGAELHSSSRRPWELADEQLKPELNAERERMELPG